MNKKKNSKSYDEAMLYVLDSKRLVNQLIIDIAKDSGEYIASIEHIMRVEYLLFRLKKVLISDFIKFETTKSNYRIKDDLLTLYKFADK